MPTTEKDRYALARTNPPPLVLQNGWIKNLVLDEGNRTDLLNFQSWDKQFAKLPRVNRELDWQYGGRLEAIWLSGIPSGNSVAICAWDVERGRHCPMVELTASNTENLGSWFEWTGDPIQIVSQTIIFGCITGGEEVTDPIFVALMGGSY